jgi:hypothetical protein
METIIMKEILKTNDGKESHVIRRYRYPLNYRTIPLKQIGKKTQNLTKQREMHT